MIFSFPVGIMAGIYMNEYAKEGPLKRFIKLMTSNLAGVPSIVFGLFGLRFVTEDVKNYKGKSRFKNFWLVISIA